MRRPVVLALLCGMIAAAPGAIRAKESHEMDTIETSQGPLNITFIGHGTLMFQFDGKTIHVDPWSRLADYDQLPDADLILITHAHRDHLDPEAIAAVRRDATEIFVSPIVGDQVDGARVVQNGEKTEAAGIAIEAVAAYNIVHKRSSGEPFHPKGEGNGYVLTFGDKRVYVAGDTESIPEMGELDDIAIAFLPMNLPYTMTPEQAADAARAIAPDILYPYHFGETDTTRLAALLKDTDIDVRIRKME